MAPHLPSIYEQAALGSYAQVDAVADFLRGLGFADKDVQTVG